MSEIHLVVGLGNPGAKYQKTRHNIGWRVVDELALRYALGAGRSEQRAMTWDGRIGDARVKLAKPLTYMNRSGESVRALMDYFDISIDHLLVVHDDLDTPFGKLKLRKSGGTWWSEWPAQHYSTLGRQRLCSPALRYRSAAWTYGSRRLRAAAFPRRGS